jgi:hypothetical protein
MMALYHRNMSLHVRDSMDWAVIRGVSKKAGLKDIACIYLFIELTSNAAESSHKIFISEIQSADAEDALTR